MEVGMRPEINPFSRLKTLREEKANISFGRLPARLLFSVVMRNKQDAEMSGKKKQSWNIHKNSILKNRSHTIPYLPKTISVIFPAVQLIPPHPHSCDPLKKGSPVGQSSGSLSWAHVDQPSPPVEK